MSAALVLIIAWMLLLLVVQLLFLIFIMVLISAATILQFMDGLRGSLHGTFEEGSCAAWLHDLLKPHLTEVVVCDPRKNALLKSGNENDRIDARKLADLLRTRLRRSTTEDGIKELTRDWPNGLQSEGQG